ncbi:MAG: diguanylate cyclase [Actinomycetia bacterium]|nr:diguanylate cyclase [Actinomycetes bacterium]
MGTSDLIPMQQLRLFPRDKRLPVVLVDGSGEHWSSVRRRLRRSRLDVEVVDRSELTPGMRFPGAGDHQVAAVVVHMGNGAEELPDLLDVTATCRDIPVVVVDSGEDHSARRALEAGAEEAIRFRNASIERLEHAVHSAVYRRNAEQSPREGADPLTGLATRATLAATLPKLIEVPGESGVAVLYCDLDRFKAINDELGHHVGDQVLRGAAARLSSAVRSSDLLVRLGGDEFVVVIRSKPDCIEDLASVVADRIVEYFSEPFRAEDQNLSIGVSVGLAVHRVGEGHAELLQRADSALYVAKRRGKSRVVSYDQNLERAVAKRKSAIDVLGEAMRRDLLDADVSPVIEASSSAVTGHLYRASWGRTDLMGATVPGRRPASVAAEGGISPALFRWLLGHVAGDESAAQLPGAVPRRWVQMPGAVLMSQPGRFLDAAAKRGVQLENLVLVIQEADLDEGPVVRNALLEIARAGARIAVGRFGAEAAALSVLELHPFEAVWLDRQMLDGLAGDSVRQAKLAAIAGVAAALGQQVVIDRPSRPEDEAAALRIAHLHVIDGHVDITATQPRQPTSADDRRRARPAPPDRRRAASRH